jgi:hypothetical protein
MVWYYRVFFLICDRPKLVAIGVLWAMMWMSINAESALQKDDFFSSLHGWRLLLPYCAASFASVWLLCLRVKPKIELWQLALVGYAGFVLARGMFLGIPLVALHFHAAILCAITLLILYNTLMAIDHSLSFSEVVLTLISTNFAFICALLLVFLPRDIFHSIISDAFTGYISFSASLPTFGMASPRPTGISRLLAVATLLIIAAFLSGTWRNYLAKVLIYFGIGMTLFYQARGGVLALIVAGLFLLLVLPRRDRPNLGEVARFFAGIVVAYVAILAFVLIGIMLKYVASDFDIINNLGVISQKATTAYEGYQAGNDIVTSLAHSEIYVVVSRDLVPDMAGSGRLKLWINGWTAFLDEPILGLGGQADRSHINQNVSNIFIYTLMCGGLVGAFFAVLAVAPSLRTAWMSVKNKYIGVGRVEQFLLLSSLTIFAFLSARGFVENSYALFNIDFLLAVPPIWYLSSKSCE